MLDHNGCQDNPASQSLLPPMMPIHPETLSRGHRCAATPERMFVHMVTLWSFRRMLLEEAVSSQAVSVLPDIMF